MTAPSEKGNAPIGSVAAVVGTNEFIKIGTAWKTKSGNIIANIETVPVAWLTNEGRSNGLTLLINLNEDVKL